eukprot:scaffold54035_cov63-Phaeocystis_antarctica.AAC.1
MHTHLLSTRPKPCALRQSCDGSPVGAVAEKGAGSAPTAQAALGVGTRRLRTRSVATSTSRIAEEARRAPSCSG